MEPRICAAPECGKTNDRHPNARYCSPECRSAAYSARKLAARHAKLGARTCKQCGNPIEDKKHPRVVFCSGQHQREWLAAQGSAKRTAARTAARSGRICANCGQVIPPDRTANADYCSDDCKRQVNLAARRANAPTYMRRYNYGITPEQWEAQLAAQDYRCVVCRSGEWPGTHDRPNADHDHTLPVFVLRGIPCGNCNHGLGKFGDDPVRLVAAARYLLTAKASPSGAGVPCDDPALLGGALRALAGGDPALLRVAADYLEAAVAS